MVGSKRCNDSETFIDYMNDMDVIHENIDEYNPTKKM